MKKVAFTTLGCKVNQYDSEAMLECFLKAGYKSVDFSEIADVYVINTCIVTATGEKKSRQMIRRAKRQNPDAAIVVAGCLAQREAEKLLAQGVTLVIGNANRGKVVELLESARQSEKALSAVENLTRTNYEELTVSGHFDRTRAALKIQEGCDRFCSYCIIPYVRGGIRSRKVDDIRHEAYRIEKQGLQEIVLTGIHLTSYGRDLDGETLVEAIRAAAFPEGIKRVRLGSLEPVVVTEGFAQELSQIPELCPQFHLALQSGSDSVLFRMRRRYTTEEFSHAVAILRRFFPGCAITTDLIAGFPGETEEEHQQSLAFCKAIGFSRIHVFPYSKREGTLAAKMPSQLDRKTKERRARELIGLQEELSFNYARTLLGTTQEVLFENDRDGGAEGYTPTYMRVFAKGAKSGDIIKVKLVNYQDERFTGEIGG